MTTIHLVRHGSHDLLGRVLTGQMPGVRLNEAGLRESDAAGQVLADAGLTAIYASPLERARQTAERIAARCGLPVAIESDLADVDFGIWTGLSFEELRTRHDWTAFHHNRATSRVPGGEAMPEVQARVVGAVRRLAARHPTDAIAVVGHADPIKLVLLHALGAPIDAVLRLEVAPASISTVTLDRDDWRVLAVNRQPTTTGRPEA
jgi:probable phosphoglycerate mutase